jgi:hypothetical protein
MVNMVNITYNEKISSINCGRDILKALDSRTTKVKFDRWAAELTTKGTMVC